MTRVSYTTMVVCDGCGVEITWAPVVVKRRMYCCHDCAQGRACECDYPPEADVVPIAKAATLIAEYSPALGQP